MEEKDLQENVKNIVDCKDLMNLDMLFVLAYSEVSLKAYKSYGRTRLKQEIEICIKHNFKEKYNMNEVNIDLNIINEQLANFSYDNFKQLKLCLKSNTSELKHKEIFDNINKLRNNNEIYLLAIKYIINRINDKISRARKPAANSGKVGFESIEGISIRPIDAESEDEIECFILNELLINLEKKNEIVSEFLGGNLNVDGVDTNTNKLYYCPTMGNILVKAGIGYWVPWVTGDGKRYYQLKVPKFLYEIGFNTIVNSILKK